MFVFLLCQEWDCLPVWSPPRPGSRAGHQEDVRPPEIRQPGARIGGLEEAPKVC